MSYTDGGSTVDSVDKAGVGRRKRPPAIEKAVHSALRSPQPCLVKADSPFAQVIREADEAKKAAAGYGVPPVPLFLILVFLATARADQPFVGWTAEVVQYLVVVD